MKKKKFLPGPLFGESLEKNKSNSSLPKKASLERANEWVEKGFLEADSKSYQQNVSKWRLSVNLLFISLTGTLRILEIFSISLSLSSGNDNGSILTLKEGLFLAKITPLRS